MNVAAFVNPYSFMPLPMGAEGVLRNLPPGHVVAAGGARSRYSGSVQVTWTLQTPMLLPLGHTDSGVVDEEGYVNVPGSSLKGVTRSLHEALFNGCMRIVDLDFVPGYRDPARTDGEQHGHNKSWRLALVVRSDKAGRPQAVRLCDDEIWLDSGQLFTAYRQQGLPSTGDVVEFDGRPGPLNSLNRLEQQDISNLEVVRRHDSTEADLETVEGRVFLVTSVGARHDYRKARPGEPRQKGRSLWASGRLGASILPVSAEAAAELQAATEGSDDRRKLRLAEERTAEDQWRGRRVFAEVAWWRPNGQKGAVGRRNLHSGFLWPGDVVWVHLSADDRIDRIRLSQLWRHGGRGPVRDRMHAANQPCNPESEAGVCLSCAIFGATDQAGERGKGMQSAYAGHVRFGSARSTSPVTLRNVLLAPLGAPKPGSGMFYLQNDRPLPQNRTLGDRATEWGSEFDSPMRPIAGRKFYWHSDPEAQATRWSGQTGRRVAPRYEAIGKQGTGEMARTASLAPAGTRVTAKVTFDAIDELSLRTLLWALDPAPLLRLPPTRRDATFAVHLGGGKSLGLGSATVELDDLKVTTVAERYSGAAAAPAMHFTSITRESASALAQRVGAFNRNLEPLARLLDLKGLGADESFVTYPPGAFWPDVGEEDFRKSFAFFVEADGKELQRGTQPWHPLPTVTPSGDQRLPIVFKKGGTR